MDEEAHPSRDMEDVELNRNLDDDEPSEAGEDAKRNREDGAEDSSLMPQGQTKSAALEIESNSGGNRDTPRPSSSLRNLIVSSVFGNLLEWYDFGVFASFSSEISEAFFTGGRLEELLKVYGVFAVAFFARPLGGFLLGLIGDRYGRTLSLQISVVAMGASALVISVLPTRAQLTAAEKQRTRTEASAAVRLRRQSLWRCPAFVVEGDEGR